jgi:hypothetical protein
LENKDLIKYGLIIGGGGLTAWGITKLASLSDTADRLTVNITRFDISVKGTEYLKFLLDLEFVNPSAQAISLSIPSIKPYYDKSEMGYSVPMQETKLLNPKAITKISAVELRVPFQNLVSAGLITDVFQALKDMTSVLNILKQKVSFKIFAVVNGLEITIEQKFGEEAKELGYIDETSGIFEGLGLVAVGRRKIRGGKEFDYMFPTPDGTDERVQHDGNVEDTVLWCGWVVKKYYRDTEKLASYLKGKSKDEKDLYKNIFDFCYNHIQYHLDRNGVEELRRPAVSWRDRKYGVDCDDFTMFIASILYNLGKPFEFRITKYNRPNYQHIYLIVPVGNGSHITIDPVLDTFNYEKPYSHKKDFNMKALNLPGRQTGLAGPGNNIGIPIEILAGLSAGALRRHDGEPDNDLLKVILGEDLKDTINGLGSAEDDDMAMLRHLKRLRNVYVKNPDYISDVQDPKQAVEMLDYAIKYWNTPKRAEAVERLSKIEDELIDKGEIRLEGIDDDDEDWEEDSEFSGVEPELAGFEYRYPDEDDDWEEDVGFTGTEQEEPGIQYRYEEPQWEEDFGFTGTETEDPDYEYDYSVDGLGAARRRKKKAKKAQKRAKKAAKKTARREKRQKKGGLFKRVGAGIKKGFKAVAKSIVKVSASPARIAFLAALRTNVGKVSDKLKYAYLTEQQAIATGIDRNEYLRLKKVHGDVEKMFKKLGGSSGALKKAILSGKRKNLRGFEVLEGGIFGIDELDEFEMDEGFTGSETENPDFDYKYDNKVWETDEDFSGVEPENEEFDYDYTFNGLDGRAVRLRKRKAVKARYMRRKNRPARVTRNPQAQEPLRQVMAWLKNIDVTKLTGKKRRKQDFLNALASNQHNVSHILAYGYKTQSQVQAEGIDLTQWQKTKEALQKTRQYFRSDFGGNEAELKKAILLGQNKPAMNGLGVAVAAAGAVTGLIGKIVGWLKDIKIKRQAKQTAKQEFQKSGGTSKEWKETGKKSFQQQWNAANNQQQQTDTQQEANTDFSDLIANQLKSGTASNYSVPGSNSLVQSSLITPVNYSNNPSGGNVKESVFKAFLKKHRTKLIVGGSILGVGTLAYFLFRPDEKPSPKKSASPKTGISGTGRKTGKKRKAVKTATHGKIKEVLLT